MGSFFDFESNNETAVKNVLYGDPQTSNVNVIVAEYLEGSQLSFLVQFFKMNKAEPLVIYPFSRIVTEHDFKKGVEKFFIDNVIENLKDFLNSQNAVVTIGRGLYAATRDVDLQVDAFYYNDDLQPSYFYCPFLHNYVYPIDALQKIVKTEYRGDFVQLYDRYVTEFAKQQIGKAVQNHGGHLKQPEPILVIEVKDNNKLLQTWIDLNDEEQRYVSLDIETGGFNRLSDEIGCITFSFDGKKAYYLDWKGIDPDLVYQFLKTRYIITANGKFDLLFMQFHGVRELKINWDTMIAGHFINEMASASLKTHAWLFTDYGGYDIELEKFKRKFPGCRYIDIPKSIKMKYAGDDAAVTWRAWKKQRWIMEHHPDMLACYEKYAIGMLDVFKEMEFRGFPIDWSMVDEQSRFLKQKIVEAEKAVFDAFGIVKTNANANLLTSKKQLGLFLEDQGWECISRVKLRIGGYYNVSKNELHEWKKKGHKEASLILEYNKWTAIYNTFIGAEDIEDEEITFGGDVLLPDFDYKNRDNATGLWQYRQIDDKIHCIYKTMMTHSHRHSCVAKGTKILVDRDEYNPVGVPIEDIKVGDYVYCLDDNRTSVIRKRKVLWAGKTGHKEVIRVHWFGLDNLLRGSRDCRGYIDVTPEHKIRLINDSYVEAQKLNGKRQIMNYYYDGVFCSVEQGIGMSDVYDLEIDEFHNFIANGIYVHNSSEPNMQNLSKRNWETAMVVRKCYTAPLEAETDKQNAHYVKVYDAEHGLRIFKPGDSFKVNWQKEAYTFEEADTIPGIIAQFFKPIPKGEYHIFEADAAGLQARIAASMSGDPKLRELFLNNGDFHSTNAYNMMARYQNFEEIICILKDGPKEHHVFMEWEPLKIMRNGKEVDHAVAKDIKINDVIESHGIVTQIDKAYRPLKNYEEFAKNCKHGKLKELRQIAKMCFAKGTKVKVTGERIQSEKIKKGDIMLMDTGINVSMFQWDGDCQKFFGIADSWEAALRSAKDMQKKYGYGIHELVLDEESVYKVYAIQDRFVNIEDLVNHNIFGVGVPYTGTRMAFDHDGIPREILGTIQVRPEEKIEFELENGETLTVTPDHEMPILRDGVRMVVPAEQVLTTDEFIEI